MSAERRPPAIAVTGLGIVTSLGTGAVDNWAKLVSGCSGVREITRFPTAFLKTRIAATVDHVPCDPFRAPEFVTRLAALAIEEALTQAAIGAKTHFPGPLFIAIPPLELEWPQRLELAAASDCATAPPFERLLGAAATGRFRDIDEACQHGSVGLRLKEKFGTRGSPVSLNTACASGATAVQVGVEALRRGEADAALCAGSDVTVTTENVIRFSLLSALSTQNDPPAAASKPFSRDRDGFVIGEGAAAMVLETVASAAARGAEILALVTGIGESLDPFHRTRSSPDGKPIAACVGKAMSDAGLAAEEIDYVNAHGTSTPENDKTECLGLSLAMGEHARRVPISSNKSMIGHTLSAAGIIEAAFTILTLRQQRIPPTINYAVPDPEIPLDVVPNVARDASLKRALSNTFGFGGQNASLVLELGE